ncbi:flagellar biosynthesis protein FlhF [Aciduricibacillus chroicocephali]|uniref:Flagellar biosynthesis protein FlhF n=1 Tax=Aciduricibacillus chroicocephali TaxID=3054939 RepID=A0ABY9KYC0_9BACI|nr:flagellar biosynthesis protein FlhF [Bacillaceae bacterium 44XB]
MKIKKYTAPTMPEAMQQIRKDLGKDAVILNSREIRKGGFLGLFSKKQLEVVAALDPDAIGPSAKSIKKSEGQKVVEQMKLRPENEELLEEIRQLKKLVKNGYVSNKEEKPIEVITALDFLVAQNINKDFAEEIVQYALNNLDKNEIKDPNMISRAIISQIESMLRPIQSKLQKKKYGRINYLVGPTGAGKTTTIAKLAAKAMLEQKKKVAFITGDTYRIAAIDQLKTYAKILEAPVKVAYEPSEFTKAAIELKDYDIIFTDTAGRNFKENKYITEIKKIIEYNPSANITLVLPLTGKSEDLDNIAKQFMDIPINSILFTKLDETASCGSIFNIVYEYGWPVSHIANGQDVPDDLFEPTVSEISKLIAGGMNNA